MTRVPQRMRFRLDIVGTGWHSLKFRDKSGLWLELETATPPIPSILELGCPDMASCCGIEVRIRPDSWNQNWQEFMDLSDNQELLMRIHSPQGEVAFTADVLAKDKASTARRIIEPMPWDLHDKANVIETFHLVPHEHALFTFTPVNQVTI